MLESSKRALTFNWKVQYTETGWWTELCLSLCLKSHNPSDSNSLSLTLSLSFHPLSLSCWIESGIRAFNCNQCCPFYPLRWKLARQWWGILETKAPGFLSPKDWEAQGCCELARTQRAVCFLEWKPRVRPGSGHKHGTTSCLPPREPRNWAQVVTQTPGGGTAALTLLKLVNFGDDGGVFVFVLSF